MNTIDTKNFSFIPSVKNNYLTDKVEVHYKVINQWGETVAELTQATVQLIGGVPVTKAMMNEFMKAWKSLDFTYVQPEVKPAVGMKFTVSIGDGTVYEITEVTDRVFVSWFNRAHSVSYSYETAKEYLNTGMWNLTSK